MDIQGKRIWQQAAGDTNRNYVSVCTDFDVILNGPGRFGAWPGCSASIEKKYSAKKEDDVRRFCTGMQGGDLVVLRMGTRQIHAVGEVVGAYEWNDEFGDVDGWDLQHLRRVRWLHRPAAPKTFDKRYSLKFGDTTQQLKHEPEVQSWIQQLVFDPAELTRGLTKLPADERTLSLAELAEFISSNQLSHLSRETILAHLLDLRNKADWYGQNDEDPSEYEAICHLALPLLSLLGWKPEQTAIEWKDIDVALFAQLPRRHSNVAVVVEAKRKGRSCLAGLEQAEGYAKSCSNCTRLILTDGRCFWVVERHPTGPKPVAYLNLARPRSAYPIYHCAGATAALRAMSPVGWAGTG